MTEINRKYTKYIEYLNNVETIFEINEINDCKNADITIVGFDKSYYKQFNDDFEYQYLHCYLWESLDKIAKLIFKEFNISLYDLYKEFKYTLPNFIYYLKIHNLNTIDDLRNRIMKTIDDKLAEIEAEEKKYTDYLDEHKNYLEFLLSTPEDFDFSKVIKEMIEDKFIGTREYHSKDKRLLVKELLIPNLRSMMIYMLSESDYVDIVMKLKYVDYGVSTPLYIKYDLFNEIVTFYEELNNFIDEDGIVNCFFAYNYEIIDFFVKRLDKYMTN